MKKTLRKIAYTVISIFLLLMLLAVDFVSTAKGTFPVSAEGNVIVNFDETDISDDLKDIDFTAYPKNENGKHELILFMEYCYSSRPLIVQNDLYGLYLYVYNPTEKAVKASSRNNVANMATSYDEKGEPSAYANVGLICLDWTEDNRFLKFKVAEDFLERAQRYAGAHDGKRRYDVAGVQIGYVNGSLGALNAEDETVAKTYFYTGYAKGCLNDSDESTLKCEVNILDTLKLKVNHTYYRTGEYKKNHRHELSSVYFSVPEHFFNEYGQLQKIKAEWYEFQTTPICITSDEEVYALLKPNLGHRTDYEYDNTNSLQLYTGYQELVGANGHFDKYDWAYNCDYTEHINTSCKQIAYLFSTNGSAISEYVLPSSVIQDYIENYNKSSSAGMYYIIGNKELSSDLFEDNLSEERAKVPDVDSPYKRVEIEADETFDMLNYDETHSEWYKFFAKVFGLNPTELDQSYKGVSPIKIVTDKDMREADLSKTLLINNSEEDLSRFKEFYNNASMNNEKVVLFRFAQTDYMSLPVMAYDAKEGKNLSGAYGADTYIVQESVFLNFDIIQLTFRDNGVDTVIPVVANPIHIINDIEIPETPLKKSCSCIPFISVQCNYDDNCTCFYIGCKKWRLVAAAIGIIILFPVLYLITYPIRLLFRGANAVARAERARRNRNKKE